MGAREQENLSAKPTKHQRNKLELRVRHSFVSPPRELNDLYYREMRFGLAGQNPRSLSPHVLCLAPRSPCFLRTGSVQSNGRPSGLPLP